MMLSKTQPPKEPCNTQGVGIQAVRETEEQNTRFSKCGLLSAAGLNQAKQREG